VEEEEQGWEEAEEEEEAQELRRKRRRIDPLAESTSPRIAALRTTETMMVALSKSA